MTSELLYMFCRNEWSSLSFWRVSAVKTFCCGGVPDLAFSSSCCKAGFLLALGFHFPYWTFTPLIVQIFTNGKPDVISLPTVQMRWFKLHDRTTWADVALYLFSWVWLQYMGYRASWPITKCLVAGCGSPWWRIRRHLVNGVNRGSYGSE